MPSSREPLSLCLLMLVMLLLTAACVTDHTASSTEYTTTVRQSSEQLLAKPPTDWKLVYQLNNISTRLSEFVPAEETEIEWSTKLSFESFKKLVDSDPIEILLAEVTRDRKNCNFVQHFNLFSGLENNFPSSVRLFLCGENKTINKGEIKMIKAIAGSDYFYLIKLLKRVEPFDIDQPKFAREEVATWSSYIRGISLCDPSKTEHPCPAS